MKTRLMCLLLCLTALCGAACAEEAKTALPFWTEDSPALRSILDFVQQVTDETSPAYLPPEERIAVFDLDGTLYGERFPTYFDTCLFLHRALHDPDCVPEKEVRDWALAAEKALLNGEAEPESPRSTAQMAAELFAGFTVEEYRAYVRAFMQTPAVGFEGMTYAEGFYQPMAALVEYLAEQGFVIFVSTGSERTLARELMAGGLDRWVPPYRVIGSTFSLKASGQGGKEGRSYTLSPEDEVLMEGNLTFKNQKMNKVITIIQEIGQVPVLVFGNSSGDHAMAQYALRHGGRGYMLLCDDTERDHGDLKTAEEFRKACEAMGLETISMRDDFAAIYGEGVRITDYSPAEALQPAA